MRDAQKPDHVSLNTLVNYLRDGRFVIPDFQREFEWKPWDIRELMRSIFLDYYIGSLLLWKGKPDNFAALSCEAVYGYHGSGKPEYIVLDGQQRLTAIYYAFLAPDVPLPNRSNRFFYFVHVDRFMAEEYDEAFGYEWLTRRWAKVLGSKDAHAISSIKAWFEDDTAEPPLIAEFARRFRNLDLRKEIRRGTSVYNGIFNLLVLQGARDWTTGDVPQHGDLDDHLCPN